ncbi:hypothetical protein ALC62_05870 [Cyphomyrmex costatus]|uniref:Tyr recombinase domain-containing protein n=1 Tax=Cyphomyrmex costatus TaxID=456900 RepID=A0A151IJA0_9HYME|nr:hypothetical protein ALC62_05870 [Cyphomyrmex costatus]
MLLASLAPSTIRQYSKPLHDWWDFCQNRHLSPFTSTAEAALDFLATIAESANSYSTINTARSAISLISLNSIGEDPLIKRFCKGASVCRPQTPRYDYVWDPAPVIKKLASDFPHRDLSLERLTRKLVMLLALGTGQRCQTLAAIRISQITLEENRALIRIPERLKTSAPGKPQPLLSIPRFENHEELCVVTLLVSYIERTEEIRPPACDSLLIALNRPHGAVGAQTISRWLRTTLSECGVADSFSAHSTRHAATSRAANKGVPLDLIKKAAGWSGASRVFAKFYNRPLCDSEAFASSVLLTDSELP